MRTLSTLCILGAAFLVGWSPEIPTPVAIVACLVFLGLADEVWADVPARRCARAVLEDAK